MNQCTDTETPAGKAYTRASIGWAVAYVALTFALVSARRAELLSAPWSWLAACAISVPIGGIMWSLLKYMRDSDEFIRALTAKRVVIALAITMVFCSVWGFLEIFAGAPHEEMYLVFPVFWFTFAGVSPLVRTTT